MTDQDLVFERSVVIHAARETVFSHFTDSERFATWWGAGSTIESSPGGRVHIRYPNGVIAGGEVVSIEPGSKIVFTFGYESGEPIALGASEVTITLSDVADGTEVRLRHVCDSKTVRDLHVIGWRYHLGVFAKIAAAAQHVEIDALSDLWFEAWHESDVDKRMALLEKCTTADVHFRDDYGCTLDRVELCEHITAAQQHMKGQLSRDGEAIHNHGTAAVNWKGVMPDGETALGLNITRLATDGRFEDIVGLWRR